LPRLSPQVLQKFSAVVGLIEVRVRHLRGKFETSRKKGKHLTADHWEVSDEQVVEMTGKSLAHWTEVLGQFDADKKRSNDVVAHLKNEHRVPGNWARTLATGYLQRRD
jgi:hypothetical protein